MNDSSNSLKVHHRIGGNLIPRILIGAVVIPLVYFGAGVLPAYQRRSELQARVHHGCVLRTFSPFAYHQNYFASRPVLPNWVGSTIGESWTLPLEPFTRAVFAPKSDDDVKPLSAEFELQDVTIVAADGICSDKLLIHLAHLPRLRDLSICNVPLTDEGIALLSRMPLKTLHVEVSAEASSGLEKLYLLTQIEELSLMDERCPISKETYLMIARMANLRTVRLGTTFPSAAGIDALAQSTSIEHLVFAYPKQTLTLECARQLAGMKSIKCIDSMRIEPDAKEFLRSKGLIEEELLILGLPPT